MIRLCQALQRCIVFCLLICLHKPTHTHTHSHICSRQAEIPPPIHRERARERGRERQIESWCVNGCSCLSHPGLFFGSLTQQSISSVLEGLVLDSSWHVPPSLRARDEGTCCAECSNTAYTHTHIHTHTHTHTSFVRGKKKDEIETVKVREEQEQKNWLKIKGTSKTCERKMWRHDYQVSRYLLSWNPFCKRSYRPFGKYDTYSDRKNDRQHESSS